MIATKPATSATPVKIASRAVNDGEPKRVSLRATGSASVYIGGDNTVSATTGFELKTTDTVPLTIDLQRGDEIWVMSAAAQSVGVLFVGR